MAASSPSGKNLSFSSCPQVSSRLTSTSARNSEASDPMRRSFSGTPFAKPPSIVAGHKGGYFNSNTPANSPSDCPRRHSIGRENIIVSLQDHDDKENGKDHNWKSAKGRSQASVKGSKNFMSPTISAASKINASPRKKVLTERNDYIRSSVSSFDGKCPSTEELDAKTEKGLNQKKEVSFDSTITYLGEGEASIEDKMALKDIDLMSQTNAKDDLCLFSGDLPVENDCVNLDPSFIISPGVSCSSPMPALAPLEADPIAPPYDPKTNYLSPRPQFRHYKPNQRIDMYLNKETDSKRLDQSFLSDCLSDTETTEEETDSDVSQKESENLYSDETSKEKEKEEELPVSGFISISPEGAAVAAKRLSKPHFFKTKKFFALFSVLAIACILMSLTNSPIIDSSLLNNLDCSELYVPHEISEFTRKSLDDIAERFKLQLSNLLSYGHKMISSFKDRHEPGALQYANLTSLLKDGLNHGYLTFDHGFIGAKIKDDKNVFGHRKDIEPLEDDIEMIEGDDDQGSEEHEHTELTIPDEDVEEVLGGDYQGFEEHEDTELTIPDDIEEVLGGEEQLRSGAEDNSEVSVEWNSEVSVEWNIPETENLNMASQDGMASPGNSVRVVTEGRSNVELRSAALQDIITVTQLNENPATEVTEDRIEAAYYTFEPSSAGLKDVKPEMLDATQAQGENVMNSAQLESILAEEIPKSRQLADTSLTNQRNSESLDFALNRYIFSPKIIAAISLLAWSLATAATIIYLKNRRPATNTDAASVMLPSMSKKLNQMQVMEEVDVVGESCPSEMSSFISSSYYKKKELAGTTEALSHERKPRKHNSRRESMASSDYSTGSPSYGSFTSYEKVPVKHGNKEEAITPVRRSSRIRSHVTST
ncbi:hypothetical protein K2173_023999 [Erythroxylum novogranatense]|uniref:Uncharacterized protein n=1 Tax=Erythroxylum novogranatense TaxID=1862640 RepID=A0AAV8TSZ8_9ROSI|nr:hypothetical protein K2173_023999 [Erythroxylum novogranatense]